MAEEFDDGQGQPQQVQMQVDERDMRTLYSNTARFHATGEEVVIDLCFNMPNPNPNPQAGQIQLLMKVLDRVVLSYSNAKRLANSLTQLVKRYEQQFGEIPTPGQQRRP